MEHKRPWIAKQALEKRTEEASYFLTESYTILQSHVIRTAWDWHKNRQIDQWARIKSQEKTQAYKVN